MPAATGLHSRHKALERYPTSVGGGRLINVTIQPAFARLRGGDDGMASGVRVFAGVAIRRAIATERDAAFLAGPQMDPARTDLHAFLALEHIGQFDRPDGIEMCATSIGHHQLFAQDFIDGRHSHSHSARTNHLATDLLSSLIGDSAGGGVSGCFAAAGSRPPKNRSIT
jgi:hypothetical protein